MTGDDLTSLFTGIRTWRANGNRAPHKPLLLLWAIGRCLDGEPRLVSYARADEVLRDLLQRFGPHRKAVHTVDPFWRLRNDRVWEVPDDERIREGPGGNAFKSSLLALNAHGGFPVHIFEELRRNPELAMRIAHSLVEDQFAPSIRDDVLEAVGLEPRFTVSRRKVRDPSFRPRVLGAYGHRCVVCDFSILMDSQPVALEAAHIKWHEARGPDEVRNGLALCALHHKLFDKGAFTVSRARTLVVSPVAAGPSVKRTLRKYDAKPVPLPSNPDDAPDRVFLDWHAREVFRGAGHGASYTRNG